jgi:hypothetical protein
VKRSILAAAVVLALADAPPARAQFVLGPVHPPGFGGRFVFGRPGFPFHRHGFRVAGFGGGFYSRSVFVAPSFFPVLPPVTTLTPFGWAPGFIGPGWGVGPGWGLGPAWGWGPGWGWFAPQPPVIVVPPPIILAGNNVPVNDAEGNPALAFEELPKPIEEGPPGAKRGDYLVIRPRKDAPGAGAVGPAGPAPGQIIPEVTRVAAVPRPQIPAFRFDPFAAKIKVNADTPDPDPVKEAARLVKLGREAFAAGEYGKAAEQFDRAVSADPKGAPQHFLKGQAAFAAGRYADAVAAIRAGLTLDPAWPAGTFDPKEPYGANPAPFAAHLAELRKTAAANPGEPTLGFLLGYQLWFVGEKVEAKKWFDAAAKRLAAPGPLALFK